MAKYINGANGFFSGKVGGVVGSSSIGIHYVKRLPKKSDKPKSEKQLAQQARFTLAVKVMHPVKDLLHTLRKNSEAASGFNLAVRQVLADAIKGDYPNFTVEYSKLIFTRGFWGIPECAEVLADNGSLFIGWFTGVFRPNCYGDDSGHILIYEPESNTYLRSSERIFRSYGMATIALPETWIDKTIHTYLFCISQHGKCSDSVYVGLVRNI